MNYGMLSPLASAQRRRGRGLRKGGGGTRKMRESQAERRARRSEKGNPGGQTAVLQHTVTDKTLRHSEPGGPVTASPR